MSVDGNWLIGGGSTSQTDQKWGSQQNRLTQQDLYRWRTGSAGPFFLPKDLPVAGAAPGQGQFDSPKANLRRVTVAETRFGRKLAGANCFPVECECGNLFFTPL